MLCQICDTRNIEDARFCAYCGTPLVVLPQVAPATQRPARPKRSLLRTAMLGGGVLLALLMACGVGVTLSVEDEPTTARAADAAIVVDEDEPNEADGAAGNGATADEEAPPIPRAQVAFIHAVESFVEPYEEAANPLQAFSQRAKRKAALAALLPDRKVQAWTGTLESLETNAAGNASITIRPDGTESMTIGTWQNAVRDGGANSLIPFGSDLYTRLAEMRVGDRIVFHGTFAASEEDHVAESSVSEAEAMTTPGFVMVFEEVTRQE